MSHPLTFKKGNVISSIIRIFKIKFFVSEITVRKGMNLTITFIQTSTRCQFNNLKGGWYNKNKNNHPTNSLTLILYC